jgi:hypothetical protein
MPVAAARTELRPVVGNEHRENRIVTDHERGGDDLYAVARALEQLREQLARQTDRTDPAAFSERIQGELAEIQQRLRLFGDTVSGQLTANRVDLDAGA